MRFPFLLLLFFSTWLQAQHRSFSRIGVNNGLSQSSVYVVFRDPKGFMWFGTGAGLNRFDGRQFIVYKHQLGDSSSIIDNTIRRIIADSRGHLWIGTERGMEEFDPVHARFIHHKDVTGGTFMPLVCLGNHVWFWESGYGLGNLDLQTGRVRKFHSGHWDGSLGFHGFEHIPESREFRVSVNSGLLVFRISAAGLPGPAVQGDTTLCFKTFTDRSGRSWRATEKGVMVSEAGSFRPVFGTGTHVSPDHVLALEEDPEGNVWVGDYGNGLFLFNERSGTLDPLSFGDGMHAGLVKTIYRDSSGGMWVGTDGEGVWHWSPYREKFARFSTASQLGPDRLSMDFIKCFGETDDHRIMVGTLEGGVNFFDPVRLTNEVSHRFGRTIQGIVREPAGSFLIVADGLVTRYDRHLQRPNVIFTAPAGARLFFAFTELKGQTWIGSSQGLYLGNNTGEFRMVPSTEKRSWYSMYGDSRHRLWFATSDRVFMAAAGSGKPPVALPVSPEKRIRHFTESAGCVWMSGPGGLLRYRFHDHSFRHYTTVDGLPDMMVYGALPDNAGRLWISTNRGLSCFEPSTGRFRNFVPADGLQSYEYNSNAWFRAADGSMYFGGVSGFNSFHPMQLLNDPHPPRTVITSVRLFDQPMEVPEDAPFLSHLRLPHDQNILSFEFASLSFTDPARNMFRYRVEGIDTGWVYAGSRNFARYANIPPGSYTLLVTSCNSDELWNEEPASLHITILPPWWGQWWFVALTVFAFIAAGLWLVQAIVNRKVREQQRILERHMAVEAERMRISKDMHDDMGSGLSQIAIMSELLRAGISEGPQVRQVEKISVTARDLVDSMGQIVWSMNPDNDRLDNLAAYIREYANGFFETTDIRCDIDFPDNSSNLRLTQRQRRNIFLVIKETLHNVLKHASASHVAISMQLSGSNLTLTVNDNGKGFDPSHTRTFGNGLRNMQKRMEEADGSFSILSAPGQGCTTVLSVRINTHLM